MIWQWKRWNDRESENWWSLFSTAGDNWLRGPNPLNLFPFISSCSKDSSISLCTLDHSSSQNYSVCSSDAWLLSLFTLLKESVLIVHHRYNERRTEKKGQMRIEVYARRECMVKDEGWNVVEVLCKEKEACKRWIKLTRRVLSGGGALEEALCQSIVLKKW